MPTYDYYCDNCKDRVEIVHSIIADPEILCKNCGNIRRRMPGTGAFLSLKGSGFYENDYKTKPKGGKNA